jgi:RNA polymerase sigma-70 factor, ECF subfamily
MNSEASAKPPTAEAPAVRRDSITTKAPASPRDEVAALYDAHADGVFGYLVALLGSTAEAEDALHDVFLRAIKRQRGLFGLRKPAAYLYRAARNEAYSRLRKRNVRARAQSELVAECTRIEPAATGVDPDEYAALNAALADLPVEQREVVVLKAFQNMTFREIAKVTRVSANTAASRYRYALEKLRGALGEEQGHVR